jgi:hypothetical protein
MVMDHDLEDRQQHVSHDRQHGGELDECASFKGEKSDPLDSMCPKMKATDLSAISPSFPCLKVSLSGENVRAAHILTCKTSYHELLSLSRAATSWVVRGNESELSRTPPFRRSLSSDAGILS